MIEIVDPLAKVAIRLDTHRKIAAVTHIPQTPQEAAPESQVVEKKAEQKPKRNITSTLEKLESKEIEGILATGMRTTAPTNWFMASGRSVFFTKLELAAACGQSCQPTSPSAIN